MSNPQPNNPLHGITLEKILLHLVEQYGWEEMGRQVNIRCFNFDPSIKSSLRFLRKNVELHLKGQGDYYWYGQYYAAQALFHSPDPSDWDEYWAKAWPIITAAQSADGLWSRNDSVGPAYNTAMALIILQIPNNYLPIFQR